MDTEKAISHLLAGDLRGMLHELCDQVETVELPGEGSLHAGVCGTLSIGVGPREGALLIHDHDTPEQARECVRRAIGGVRDLLDQAALAGIRGVYQATTGNGYGGYV